MVRNGTWKSEPANEDGWGVDWSIQDPEPDYIDEESFLEIVKIKEENYGKI